MTATTHRPYYPALDGLRGVAILLVVVYHNFGYMNQSFFGWLGVDLFFVLSGFLITGILLNTVERKDFLRNFYMRRVLRIFPLYYLSLVILLLILPRFTAFSTELAYYTDNQGWLWTYLQNWLYIFKANGNSQVMHHFWSLAVEEQFYLVWPFVVLALRKPRSLLLVSGIFLVGVILLRYILWTQQFDDFSYYDFFTFSRVDGIIIGSMLALLQRIDITFFQRHTSWIVLSLAALNFLFYFANKDVSLRYPYLAIIGYTTFAILFAFVVHEGSMGNNKVINFLFDNRILKFFGKISYGFYVLHWPIYVFLNGSVSEWLSQLHSGLPIKLTTSIICTLLAIGISLLSFRYFERYFIRLKTKYQ